MLRRTARKPRKISWRRFVVTLLAVVVSLWVLKPLVWQIGFGLPGDADFYLHRSEYQSIVTRIKALPLTQGTKKHTRLDGFAVDAERTRRGSYVVTITTRDWNHAGIYGYVFSDTPLTPQADTNYPGMFIIDGDICGDMPFVDKNIVGQGGRWWSVYNNLL